MNVVCRIKSEMLRDYLKSQFALEDGAFSVFRRNDIGKHICSLVKTSDLPIHQELDEESVLFRLPKTGCMPSLYQKFCYLTLDDQKRVEDYIQTIFNVDFGMYYLVGKNYNIMEKTIITNFILERKLDSMIGDVEKLKKRKYREYEKNFKTVHQRLRVKAYEMTRVFTETIKQFPKTLTS